MKTNKIKIFFSIISFCFLVTSCNNLLSELTQQKTYIQISTNLGNTNQRTVLPDFSVVKENGYTWELYCDGKILQTWNDANGKSAYQNMCESKIEVDPGSYSFDLVIKKDIISNNNEIKSVTLLKGTISDCAISEGSNNLSFIMNPLPVTEGTGTINFTLNLPYDSTVTSADAELSLYGGIEDKSFITENFESIENSSISVTFPTSQINSGTYLLKIYLKNKESVVNVYYTIVVIYPGECSTETVTLTQLTKYYNVTTHYIDAKTNEEIESTSVYYKKDSVFTLPEVSRDDYSFGGYYNDPNFTTPIYTITINQDKDIYVKYIKDLAYVEDVLEIYTERGLKTFRNIVNNLFTGIINVGNTVFYSGNSSNQSLNAILCNDIVLSDGSEWVPIGNGKYEGTSNNIYYEGSFNGNGKGVTNLRITSNESSSSTESSSFGFFGSVKNATIKNLYVSGEIKITCNQNDSVGGIVGYAKDNSKIDSCVNNVIITVTGSSNVGGIIGSSNNSSVSNCINVAELSGESGAGIIGSFSNTSDEKITIDCVLNLGNLNFSNNGAGIIYIGSFNVEVSNSINTGVISGTTIYPICNNYNNNNQNSNTVTNCFYDSDKIQNVPEISSGSRTTSSDLDGLPLDGWYNTVSDSKYPIPSTIQEAFENKSSCWGIIFEAANIEASSGYVPGAYYVNETGNDTNDGSSIDEPYQKLTKAITNAIASDAKTVYVSGTLTPSNQGITSPSSESHEKNSVFYIQDNDFDDVVEIIGDSGNTNFSGNNQTRIFSTQNACNFKMKNINFINGSTDGSGAAIYFWQGSLELDSCKISGNSSTDSLNGNAYNGIYNYGGSVLKMTNTTCENSVYLSNTTATIYNDCTIGTARPEATDGFITLDEESTLILDGKNIDINKPIYIHNEDARIELGSNFEPTGSKIQIKINPDLENDFTLFNSPPDNLLDLLDLFELVESEDFTLGADGQIIKKL